MYTSVFESAIDKLNISDIHKNAIKQINKACLEAIQYVNDVQLHRCLRIAKYVTTHRQPFSADEVDYAQKVLNVTNPSTLKAETDDKMVAMLKHLSSKEREDFNKWSNEYENKQNIEKARLGYNVDDSYWGAETKKVVRYVLAHKDEVPNNIVRLAENLSKRKIQSGNDTEAQQLRAAVMKANTDIGKKFRAWVDRGEKDEEVKPPEQVQQAQQQTTMQTQSASKQGENVNETNSKRTPKGYPIFSDEEMGALQEYLNSKGANLEVDKKIGPKTTWWLQKISGISKDYKWGPNTQKAYEDLKPKIQEFIKAQNANNQQQQQQPQQ